MLPARLDSLFARLLLAQLLLVGCCVMLFGWFVIVERNVLQIRFFADAWAPAFTAAATLPPQADSAPVLGLPGGIRHQAGPPASWRLQVDWLPSATALRKEMALRGVRVDATWLALAEGEVRFWTLLRLPSGSTTWISGATPDFWPHWSRRTTFTLGLLLLLVAGVSWMFARRVTSPLDQLRQRMHNHAHGSGDSTWPPLPPMTRRAPPELVEMDAAYTQLAQRLQRNERERALLLAGISHDLRSPLARIRLAAELLPESADNRDDVASITRNVDHADQLIASFLEFVRASAPDLELQGSVDLVATTRQAASRFERRHQDLAVHAPASLVLHRVPALLLDRLVANLVDNALKHGAPPVVVKLWADGDAAVLTVSDAGPGLPPAGASALVEAFARGDASRSVAGVGLGLAIAQQIVLRLGGTLAFERDRAGHRVRVRLPLVR